MPFVILLCLFQSQNYALIYCLLDCLVVLFYTWWSLNFVSLPTPTHYMSMLLTKINLLVPILPLLTPAHLLFTNATEDTHPSLRFSASWYMYFVECIPYSFQKAFGAKCLLFWGILIPVKGEGGLWYFSSCMLLPLHYCFMM